MWSGAQHCFVRDVTLGTVHKILLARINGNYADTGITIEVRLSPELHWHGVRREWTRSLVQSHNEGGVKWTVAQGGKIK